jgi:hypothetical protein
MSFAKTIFVFLFLIFYTSKDVYSDFIMPISADLDSYDIRIGYGFSGGSLTLFGSKEKLEKIAVILSGPERDFLLNKRQKVYGLWVKRDINIFHDIGSYYAAWVSHDLRKKTDILDFYGLKTFKDRKDGDLKNDFEQYMMGRELYYPLDTINIANNNLFKINIPLPSNATVGNYLVNVISLGASGLSSKISMSFDIIHSEFNKFIYDLNKEYHKLYAILVIVVSFINILLVRYFIIN